MLSSTHENVAYRICQELDFDILLTGHQHMSVPGQMVSGTFVVQPSDRGQEFLRIEAVVSGTEKRLSSHTIPAGEPAIPSGCGSLLRWNMARRIGWIRWSVTCPTRCCRMLP